MEYSGHNMHTCITQYKCHVSSFRYCYQYCWIFCIQNVSKWILSVCVCEHAYRAIYNQLAAFLIEIQCSCCENNLLHCNILRHQKNSNCKGEAKKHTHTVDVQCALCTDVDQPIAVRWHVSVPLIRNYRSLPLCSDTICVVTFKCIYSTEIDVSTS